MELRAAALSTYASLEAGNGPSVLKVLESEQRPNLTVTDVGLPSGQSSGPSSSPAIAENAVVGNGHLEPGMAILTKPFANKVRGDIEER